MRRDDDLVDLSPAHDTPRPRSPYHPPEDPEFDRGGGGDALVPRWVVRAMAVAAAVAVVAVPVYVWRDWIKTARDGPKLVTPEQVAAAASPAQLPPWVVFDADPAKVTDTGMRYDDVAKTSRGRTMWEIHDKMVLIDLGGKVVLAQVPQSYTGGPFLAVARPLNEKKSKFITDAGQKHAHLGDKLQPYVLYKSEAPGNPWGPLAVFVFFALVFLIVGFKYGSRKSPPVPVRRVPLFRG